MEIESKISNLDRAVAAYRGTPLSAIELAAIRGSCAGQTYEEIATATQYSVSYLSRTFCPQLWQLLSDVCGVSIGKKNLLTVLESLDLPVPKTVRIDWGEAIDVSEFQGRAEELATLATWANERQCRTIEMLGMGGVGKTALSVKLCQQVGAQFEYAIWRSLRNAPPLATLLADLVSFLSDRQEIGAESSKLFDLLRQSRCLVVLDNLETLLDAERVGQFRAGFEGYGELLRSLAEVAHQSCIIFTSREKPAAIAALGGEGAAVRSLRLDGSPEAAQFILHSKQLIGTAAQKQLLGDRYGNNPLALKIVATSIQELFDRQIGDFLQEDTLVFNGIRHLLDRQFERLSEIERSIMYWLAINREWTGIDELLADIAPAIPKHQLLEALEALRFRCLLERQGTRFTQQPVVMEYALDRVISTMAAELQTGEFSLFLSHATLKTTVTDYISQTQARLIARPLAAALRQQFPSDRDLLDRIATILNFWRSSPGRSGYGAGNLLNLCQQGKIDLSGADFSELTIRHADLRHTDLHRVDFSQARFSDSVFIQPFGNVLSLKFSPNGEWLATGDTSGRVRLWKVSDGQPDRTWQGHTWCTKAVCFSPDGKYLASGSYDSSIKIWDLQTGRCLRTLQEHRNLVMAVEWSHDSRTLISAELRVVKIWDALTGECVGKLETAAQGTIDYIARHPTKDIFAICLDDRVQVWDLPARRCLGELIGHELLTFDAAWHPDGHILATAAHDRTIKIWDVAEQTCLRTIQGDSQMWAVLWLADGRTLVGDGANGWLRVWDSETGACLRTIAAHTSSIWGIVRHPTLPLIATGSDDQNIKFWHTTTWECLRTFQGYDRCILALALSPDERTLAISSQDLTVRLWAVTTGECIENLHGHENNIWCLDWHPDGKLLASGSHDGSCRIWDTRSSSCVAEICGSFGIVHTVAWHPDGEYLAIGTMSDFAVSIWNVADRSCVRTLTDCQSIIMCLVWSPDGRTLAAAGYDNTIRVWDADTGQLLHSLCLHQNAILGLAWSPDGRALASAAHDRTIRIWDAKSGACLQSIDSHAWLWSVDWSADGSKLVSGSQDGKLQVWDLAAGKCTLAIAAHPVWIRRAIWTANDTRLISGGADGTVKIWDASTGEHCQTLRPDRPYEGTNITGATDITESQKVALQILGAICD